MKEITLEYRHRGRTRTLAATIPASLSEATPAQFLALLGLSEGAITEEMFFCQFFGISSDILARLDPWQLYVMASQLQHLWQRAPVDRMILPRLTVSPDTSAMKGFPPPEGIHPMTLTPPAPRLRGMTFQQFMTVDQLWQWYAYTDRADYLHAMVAALYIPDDADFFTYDHGLVTEAVAHSADTLQLQAIATNWTLVRDWLASAYPHLFPARASSATVPGASAAGQKKPRPGSWLAILDALVADDLTRLQTYPRLQAMDVIRILNRRIADAKRPRP